VIVALDQLWVCADSKGQDLGEGIAKRKQVRALTRGAIEI
jgi:hypothetical protein